MTERSIAGIRAVADAQQAVDDATEGAGLEFVGREHGTNRKARRDHIKALKALTRRPDGDKRWYQPLLGTLTPYGSKLRKRRRAAAKVARKARAEMYARRRRS